MSPSIDGIVFIPALALVACSLDVIDSGQDSGASAFPPPPEVVGWEVRDVEIPGALHVQGLVLPGKLFVPKLAGAAPRLPGVLVLHGSGGLFKGPEGDTTGPCSPELEPQFAYWGETLARLGYVTLMPASFNARGFCDYDEDSNLRPDDFDDERERMIGRLYDADAATRFLCDEPEVDCSRLGVMGFSNGASVAMLLLHWQLERALTAFAASEGPDLDLPVVVPPAGRPALRVGVSFYPGCAMQSTVDLSTDAEDPREDMYFPSAELHIEHGSSDSLISDCSVEYGEGRREIQAGLVAEAEQVTNTYHVKVHIGAKHSFDNAVGPDEEGGGSERPEDVEARDAARASTLTLFADRLGGARP